jgi:hypothetical protein
MDPVLGSDEGHDIEMEEVEPQQVLRYCDTQLMLEQEGRIINRVLKTADYVADLETLSAGQFRTQTRIDPKEYNARRTKHLDKISSTINGFAEHDVEVPIHILESDFAQTDDIFKNCSSGEIKDNLVLSYRDVFGSDSDGSKIFDSEEESEFEFNIDEEDVGSLDMDEEENELLLDIVEEDTYVEGNSRFNRDEVG